MRVRVIIGVVAVAVALLVASQLLLPSLAEHKLRDDLAGSGDVRSVSVSAFPAIKLVWRHADRVRVRFGRLRLGRGELADRLDETRHVGRVDAHADVLRVSALTLRDIDLTKRGPRLHAEAALSKADLDRALPAGAGLKPVGAGGGELTVEVTAGPVAVRAIAAARGGALVITPTGVLSGVATVTVFSDPRIQVTGVGARTRPGGYVVTVDGRLA